MIDQMHDNQMRYIKREQEYKDVIKNIELKIQDNSTKPLEINEEKTQDQYLLEGIDINDKEMTKEITRKRMLQQANEIMIDNKNNLNPTRNIKEIHNIVNGINQQLELAQKTIGNILKDERRVIWSELDKKVTEINEQIRREAEKKKDDQYDYHQKEKELTEHLETMT